MTKTIEYADVFISHKREDIDPAKALAQRVQQLGYTCYLDALDKSLEEKSAGVLAEHIRTKLRGARAILFFYTQTAMASKWMPWELGFFDGRWGKTTVGIYLPGGVVPSLPARSGRGSEGDTTTGSQQEPSTGFTIQEYLDIYDKVTDATLADFLHRAASIDTLANRSDVDVDRFMTMLTAACRNPLAFQFGWAKYMLGTARPFLEGNALAIQQLDAMIDTLGLFRGLAVPLAKPRAASGSGLLAEPPSNGLDMLQNLLPSMKQAHEAGVKASALG